MNTVTFRELQRFTAKRLAELMSEDDALTVKLGYKNKPTFTLRPYAEGNHNIEPEISLAAESPAQTERVEDIPTEKQEVENTMEAKDVREIFNSELAERERSAELVRLQEAVKQKDAALADLDAALKAEKAKPPETISPLNHFETCKDPDCQITKELNALIARAQKPESLGVEAVKAAMKHYKIDEAPERIIISGLGGKKK